MDRTVLSVILWIGAAVLLVLFLMRRRKRRMSGK
jgi:LPXTG-motif cell wall-anchored protein